MELREIRYFVALAEELHFGRAAERIGIDQSPLSRTIISLERQLGVQLFARTQRSTQLTRIGEALLADARRILAEVERAHRGIAAAASGRKGPLRIALGDGLGDPRIARLLAQTLEEDPHMDLQVQYRLLSAQFREVRSGILDIGFALSPMNDEELSSVPLWKSPLSATMRRNHLLASLRNMKAADLGSVPLLFLGEHPVGSSHDNERFFAWFDVDPPRAIEYIASVELLLTLVVARNAVGILSAAQAKMIRHPDLVTRPIGTPAPMLTTYLFHRRNDESKLVARFIARAQTMGVKRA
jgi:DNA-binding transcriptional LysR family regulator